MEHAKILIVDDDQDILNMCEAILSGQGYFTSTVTNAVDAMDKLIHYPFDILLCDANMPIHSGFDFIRSLRQNDRFKNLMIAMLTGRREKKDIERALKLGVNDYIIKPVDPLILIEKVASLYQKKPAQNEHQLVSLPLSIRQKGHLEFEINIISLSEVGFKGETSLPLQRGQFYQLNSSFFNEFGMNEIMIKIVYIEQLNQTSHFIFDSHFIGTTDLHRQKIRSFIYREYFKVKKAV